MFTVRPTGADPRAVTPASSYGRGAVDLESDGLTSLLEAIGRRSDVSNAGGHVSGATDGVAMRCPAARLNGQARRGPGHEPVGASKSTIHGVPKRSTHMPSMGDQKVSAMGIVTSPPSARASNTRVASATAGTV